MASVHQKQPPPSVATSVWLVELFITLVWARPVSAPTDSSPKEIRIRIAQLIARFCLAVTCEFGFIAARSACNLATGVSAAGCVAFGFVGCCGGAGGGTPCRTLFWSLNSLARCLIMASEPAAKVLAGRKIAKVRETNIGFIRTVPYLQQPASPRPNCQPRCEVL